MEITWRLPDAWGKQPPVRMALQIQGFTPWHHPLHGSHWLRLQTGGAWCYKDDNDENYPDNIYGWIKAMAAAMEGGTISRERVFTMTSVIKKHMSKEDLGMNTSE